MKWRFTTQIYILLLAVALYLYFWQGWIAVAIYIVAVVVLYLLSRHKKVEKKTSPKSVEVENVAQKRADAIIARRREQGERLRAFAVAVEGSDAGVDRLVRRLLDWHLEYSRANGYYHIDLYDFLLDKCKERLSTAEADYLKRELRLSIEIIRQLMRGRSITEIKERVLNN